jgi:hypothetical protein
MYAGLALNGGEDQSNVVGTSKESGEADQSPALVLEVKDAAEDGVEIGGGSVGWMIVCGGDTGGESSVNKRVRLFSDSLLGREAFRLALCFKLAIGPMSHEEGKNVHHFVRIPPMYPCAFEHLHYCLHILQQPIYSWLYTWRWRLDILLACVLFATLELVYAHERDRTHNVCTFH